MIRRAVVVISVTFALVVIGALVFRCYGRRWVERTDPEHSGVPPMDKRLAVDAAIKYVDDARWRITSADLAGPSRGRRSRRRWLREASVAAPLATTAHLDGTQLALEVHRQFERVNDTHAPLDAHTQGQWLLDLVKELVRRAQVGEIDARIAVEAMSSQFATRVKSAA